MPNFICMLKQKVFSDRHTKYDATIELITLESLNCRVFLAPYCTNL